MKKVLIISALISIAITVSIDKFVEEQTKAELAIIASSLFLISTTWLLLKLKNQKL